MESNERPNDAPTTFAVNKALERFFYVVIQFFPVAIFIVVEPTLDSTLKMRGAEASLDVPQQQQFLNSFVRWLDRFLFFTVPRFLKFDINLLEDQRN